MIAVEAVTPRPPNQAVETGRRRPRLRLIQPDECVDVDARMSGSADHDDPDPVRALALPVVRGRSDAGRSWRVMKLLAKWPTTGGASGAGSVRSTTPEGL
jgi:hypothetical protein